MTPPGFVLRLVLLGILGATAYAFRSLTVEIDDTNVRLSFGEGVIKKSFPLSKIESMQAVRTTPVQGWGIHWIGRGWLYNIYGLKAVELHLSSGQDILIGTDDQDNLIAALESVVAITDQSSS